MRLVQSQGCCRVTWTCHPAPRPQGEAPRHQHPAAVVMVTDQSQTSEFIHRFRFGVFIFITLLFYCFMLFNCFIFMLVPSIQRIYFHNSGGSFMFFNVLQNLLNVCIYSTFTSSVKEHFSVMINRRMMKSEDCFHHF